MIQITISEKDNPKVAGWLMDNNIEYSSVPIETGKHKPFIAANVRDILDMYDSHEITHSRMVELLNEVAADYYSKQPVPVSVGYSLEDIKKAIYFGYNRENMDAGRIDYVTEEQFISSLTPTEQQEPPKK